VFIVMRVWHLGNRPSLPLRDCEYVVLVPLLVVVDGLRLVYYAFIWLI